jgi:hypothetical protein
MKIIITERQNKLLMEGLPASFRRRYNYNLIKNHLDFTILESINPCDWDDLGDFVEEICNSIVEDLRDDYYYENGGKIDSKTKDTLYYFMIDNFYDYLANFYDKQCA